MARIDNFTNHGMPCCESEILRELRCTVRQLEKLKDICGSVELTDLRETAQTHDVTRKTIAWTLNGEPSTVSALALRYGCSEVTVWKWGTRLKSYEGNDIQAVLTDGIKHRKPKSVTGNDAWRSLSGCQRYLPIPQAGQWESTLPERQYGKVLSPEQVERKGMKHYGGLPICHLNLR